MMDALIDSCVKRKLQQHDQSVPDGARQESSRDGARQESSPDKPTQKYRNGEAVVPPPNTDLDLTY